MRFILAVALVLSAGCPASKSSAPGPTEPAPGPGSAEPAPADPNAGSATPSEPSGDCVCTMQYDPVCGVDGKTYGNACAAGCSKVEVASKGECPK